MSGSYLVAATEVVEEIIVNRSRFICYLAPCQSKGQAKDFVKSIQEQHPNANHHCYAFVCGAPDDSQRYGFSDDGEPSGTAGKPMLIALQGSEIGEVCAVVVRYFGGVKLGTGGLQRAYGGSVRQALALLTTKTKIPMVHRTLACQYTHINDVHHILAKVGAKIVSEEFLSDIRLKVALPEQVVAEVASQLQTMSAGQIILQKE
ncbi:YigZ family protein [Thalassotalea ganghwensis]